MKDAIALSASWLARVGPLGRMLRSVKLSYVFVLVGLLVVATAVALSAFFVTSLYNKEVISIRNRLEFPAQSMMHVVGQIGANADLALRDIQAAIVSGENLDHPSPALQRLLLERTYGRAAARKIEIYDRTGKAIVSTLADPAIPVSVAAFDFFRRQIEGQADRLITSELVADPIDGKPKIIESRPIIDDGGTVRGVVAVYIDADYFQKLFDSLPMPAGSNIVLFNADGRQLVRAPSVTFGDPVLATDFSQRTIYKSFRDAKERGTFGKFTNIVGADRFIAGVAGADSTFIVTAGWDASAALAHWRSEATGIIGGTVVAIIIFAGLFACLVLQLWRNEARLNSISASQEMLHSLVVTIPDAVMIIDRSLKIYFANPAAEKLYGYETGEMTGLSIGQIMCEAHRSNDEQSLRAALNQAQPSVGVRMMERRARRKDGSEFPIEVSGCPFESPDGRVLVSLVRDITERQAKDLALRDSRENLARAQEIAGIGSFSRDIATGRTEWSDEGLRIWGISDEPSQQVIEFLTNLVHPEDRQQFIEGRKAVLQGKPAPAQDFRIIRPDGEERILHHELSADFDEYGKPVRLFGTIQDITERKKIELALHRSRENLARAQHMAAIGSFERDLITNKAEWSDEMYRILGVGKAETLPGSETLTKLVHPDDRDRFVEYRSKELLGEPITSIEYRIIRSDGAERIVHRESAVVFDGEKRPIRRYGTLQDITELRLAERRERELERQLLHSQKLEALGTLAGGIAHDLNNTLTPIMALSKMTAQRLEPGSMEQSNLDMIFAASEQARDLVKRVLAFSRRDKIDKTQADLREIVSDALQLLRATIPSSIQLETRIGEVPLILADTSQIHQVVTNLVTNAAQAIGNRIGAIMVTLDVALGSEPEGAIRLSVTDTGDGMDEATRTRIFEPFFTTKEVGQGTGLGLSIIAGIVSDHGGRIEVESAPGKGSRFDIYFPLQDAQASAAA